MKKYKVNVNGIDYEVKLEVLEDDGKAPAPAAPAQPAQSAPPAPAVGGNGENVSCPMPGTILSVSVSVGDTVQSGQLLMVLEAMKMENEILAPVAGKITKVSVAAGATVESGAHLCTIS